MLKNIEKTSNFLSLVLRHSPETIGLKLDEEGWADIEQLISSANAAGHELSRELLTAIVSTSDKQRFAISGNGTRIRANQGHSVQISLKLKPQMPPSKLFHGTATRFEAAIRKDGLLRGSRQHVHLSTSTKIASTVGARHGKPLTLTVLAGKMHQDGIEFYLSENGIWLTESVPVQYIVFDAATQEWLEPWWSTSELPQEVHETFKKQLSLEVGPEHIMYGLPVRLIGRGNGDDALFEILDGTGRVADVHLTWSRGQERLPWPGTTVYANFSEWITSVMIPDHKDWVG